MRTLMPSTEHLTLSRFDVLLGLVLSALLMIGVIGGFLWLV